MIYIQFIDYERNETSPTLGPFSTATITYSLLRISGPNIPLQDISWLKHDIDNWVWNNKYWSDICIFHKPIVNN